MPEQTSLFGGFVTADKIVTSSTIHSFYTKLAGVTYDNRQEIIKLLHVGDKLRLLHEMNNEYDKYAMAVFYEDKQVGYLKKDVARQVCLKTMYNKKIFEIEVTEITGLDKEFQGVNVLITEMEDE